MNNSSIITPKVAIGRVSRQTNLGVDSYDLDELYSPDTAQWRSKVLDLGSPKYPPQVATAPTRYWFDRSRYNNHGTITGAIWKQLPSGVWVPNFDGTDDSVIVSDAASLSALSALTIAVWFNSDAAPVSEEALISKAYAAAATREWVFIINSAGRLTFAQSDGVNFSNYLLATGTTNLSDTKFHSGAVTWNGVNATGNIVLYADEGVETLTANTKSGTGGVPVNTASDIEIGREYQNNTYCFDGVIGEVWIFNQVLTLSQYLQWRRATKWRYT